MAKGDQLKKCDEFGIDEVAERLMGGETQTSVAAVIGVSQATLINWIASDPERSARAREARIAAARTFDDMAEQVLLNALDTFGLAKARELASHYRWKAAKANPREYGEKIEIDQKTTLTDLTEEQLDAKLAKLLAAGG
jgi:hypothetical protein